MRMLSMYVSFLHSADTTVTMVLSYFTGNEEGRMQHRLQHVQGDYHKNSL